MVRYRPGGSAPRAGGREHPMIAPPPAQSPPPEAAPPPTPTRAATLLVSFRYAFAGIRYLLWTQRNAKIHTAIAIVAVALALLLRIDRGEWLALVLTIALVLGAEGVNTAVEAAVDLASPGYHPLAKIAKDVAAGMVLLIAIAAVIVGLIIFLPHLLPIVLRILGL
ncbi:MAG TPA: diacylglycerol kinase family protein [Roseiflexaceae bacterium]